MALMEIKNLSSYYNTKVGYNQALDGFSLRLEEGEVLGLIGESGCGKSTAAISFMKMLQYPGEIISGEVLLAGKELFGLSENELRRVLWKEIAMIPQSAMNALDPCYKIGDQILEALHIHYPHLSKKEAKARVFELLKMVGIDEKWFHSYPHKLSGGMKQRVVIAMALSCDPKVIISDESTTGLDVLIEAQILALLNKIKKERGLSVIVISHDLHMVTSICTRVGIMYAGHLVELAGTEEIRKNPRHPYTRALFASQIDVMNLGKKVQSIEGTVPNLVNPEKHCRFYSRCTRKDDSCREKKSPELLETEEGHYVACHRGDRL